MGPFQLKISKREKVILVILAVGLICFLFYQYVYTPQSKRYQKLKSGLGAAKIQLEQDRKTVAALPQERERLEFARERFNKAREPFFTRVQDGGAIIDLGLAALSWNVTITSYQPQKIINKDLYLELPVRVTLRGSYREVLMYLYSLETRRAIPNLVALKQLNITPVVAQTDSLSEEDIITKINLIFYSETSPEGRLALEKIAKWQINRPDPFAPAKMLSPYPGVKPRGMTENPAPAPEKTVIAAEVAEETKKKSVK